MLLLVNAANILSLLRLLVTPLIVYSFLLSYNKLAFFLFILASLSDAADGIVARKFGYKSVWGAYLDAIADKVLLLSVLLALSFSNLLPSWFAIVIAIRESFIIVAVVFSFVLSYRIEIRAIAISKAHTVLLMLLIIVILYAEIQLLDLSYYTNYMLYLITLLTLASALVYFWRYSKTLLDYGGKEDGRQEK